MQHEGRSVGRSGDGSGGEPNTVRPDHPSFLHTRAMVEGFRSPLAPDALAGRFAIVTGGGTGIGAATARAIIGAGGSVAICGRRPEPIAAVADELGDRCFQQTCDVREGEQVGAFLDAIGQRTDRVDILVNNAGGQFAAGLENTSLKGMRAVHRLNVDATWDVTTRVAERWMIPHRGGFVAFLGFSPRRGIPQVVPSSMARSALETFAAGIAIEWSRFGIRAVCVSPGVIQTEGILQYGGQEVVDAFAEQIPMRRPGTAEEVAATIAFLASDGGGYITGTTVVVDGGADAWGQGHEPPALEP
jgi:citronellol/citronellal dehydrogenase